MRSFFNVFLLLTALSLSGNALAKGSPKMEKIVAPDYPISGPYSHGYKAGGLIFLSGVVAINPKTKKFADANIEAQTKQVFDNIIGILAAAGKTLDDVVKVSVFLKNPADFKPMNKIYTDYFKDHKPARTTVPGADWGRPDILIVIDITAVAD